MLRACASPYISPFSFGESSKFEGFAQASFAVIAITDLAPRGSPLVIASQRTLILVLHFPAVV